MKSVDVIMNALLRLKYFVIRNLNIKLCAKFKRLLNPLKKNDIIFAKK